MSKKVDDEYELARTAVRDQLCKSVEGFRKTNQSGDQKAIKAMVPEIQKSLNLLKAHFHIDLRLPQKFSELPFSERQEFIDSVSGQVKNLPKQQPPARPQKPRRWKTNLMKSLVI